MDPTTSSPTRCAYKSGKCTNARTRKLNGGQHSLCALHREKQNAHQRKSDRKARQRKAMQLAADPLSRSSTSLMQLFTYTPEASDGGPCHNVPVVMGDPNWTSNLVDEKHQHIDDWCTRRHDAIVPTSAVAAYSAYPEPPNQDTWLSPDEIKPCVQPVRLPSIRDLLHPVYARNLFPSHSAA
ncbi:hypothetical protein SPRG_01951 [Saprolegnia parasitica CBS 223.65]|uniref:Uncharacterized protein n=1 Tax=Saprolegnia parasitica (strain CBS 223.65) TaxID=695850 RepID=A0A067CR13_SAPPC|nr:hypothetical protein SPRG_01951 [Saprolegnia parasitica CBS 223.65]KDO33139.1 hypothetical protein SPRG_01951 [Saprolegnia parasitica CBS 223.65]|eukprot:XP_012195904.1 hypothetical protein SPRG_01951 [Saprolegnia parasitica CBS 223.65]